MVSNIQIFQYLVKNHKLMLDIFQNNKYNIIMLKKYI